MRRPSAAAIATVVAVGGATLFVLSQLQPSLLLADTTPAGGDMGAHVWGPAYLRDHLLPHGRITGWAPDWYGGFPYLTFYFPLPSLLIVLVDLALPYGVAFKLVSVLGVVGLPVAAWAFGRLAGARPPVPAALAVATLPFLFDQGFSIYGGNILSTLAGEFAFSLSLSLALAFLGVLTRGLDTGRHRALASALLALTGLCHVIPTLFALVGAAVLTLLRPDRRRLRHTVTVGAVGGLLAAFWIVPFLLRSPYLNDMGWEKVQTYASSLFPERLGWTQVLAGGAALWSLSRRHHVGVFLTVMASVSAAVFVLAPQGRLWNARLLPFWLLCVYLLAGLGLAEVARWVGDKSTLWGSERGPWVTAVAAPVTLMVGAVLLVATPLHILPAWAQVATTEQSIVPGWARWNYSGYERKDSYPEYRDLITTMTRVGATTGCGRAHWEYQPELDRLGTPMALMLLPYWTKGCIGSMEGLFFESSATTPYHFLSQSELSKAPSRAQRDLPYRELDVAQGVEHLQLLGVRYYMAITPEAQAQARDNPDLRLVATSGPWDIRQGPVVEPRTWEVFEVLRSDLVEALDNKPVVMTGVGKGGREWQTASVQWYQNRDRWSVPLAADGPEDWLRVAGGDAQPPGQTVPTNTVSNVRMNDDRISFDVDRPGVPVLVKASYFPNWQASGAKGPWRVTPNHMLVVPTRRHVQLRYGTTLVDRLGWVLTGLGILGLMGLSRKRPEPAHGPDGLGAGRPTPPPAERRPRELAVAGRAPRHAR